MHSVPIHPTHTHTHYFCTTHFSVIFSITSSTSSMFTLHSLVYYTYHVNGSGIFNNNNMIFWYEYQQYLHTLSYSFIHIYAKILLVHNDFILLLQIHIESLWVSSVSPSAPQVYTRDSLQASVWLTPAWRDGGRSSWGYWDPLSAPRPSSLVTCHLLYALSGKYIPTTCITIPLLGYSLCTLYFLCFWCPGCTLMLPSSFPPHSPCGAGAAISIGFPTRWGDVLSFTILPIAIYLFIYLLLFIWEARIYHRSVVPKRFVTK